MKNFKILSYSLFLLWFVGTATAQTSSAEDRMYENMAYKELIKLYESREELSSAQMEQIANGYRLNHDTENAALWFGQVILDTDDPINYLYYAQALQSNGDLANAKKYYLKYDELSGSDPTDQRGIYLAAAIDRMNEWENDEDIILKREDAINSENLDFSPALFKNGIVFVSSRKLADTQKYKWTDEYFMNLYYATANKEGELEHVQSFSKMINSRFHEGPVAFSKGFDRIFFTRNDHLKGKLNKNKKGVLKLGIFTALSDGDQWTEPRALDFNTAEYEECHPSVTADGKLLYFASDRDGGQGGMDIYVSEFSAGNWGEPTNLGPNINTPGNDVFPFIHDDGTLYFASDGWGGMGGLDIFYTKKEETNQWTPATNMGQPYNSRKDDFGFVLNVLGTEGYLNSSREGGKGKDDIYSFKRRSFQETNDLLDAATNNLTDGTSTIIIDQSINNYYHGIPEGKKSEILEEEIAEPVPVIKKDPEPEQTVDLMVPKKNEKPEEIVITKKPLPAFDLMVRKKEFTVGEKFEMKNLYYDFDRQEVNKESTKELDRLIIVLQNNPTVEIELSAHTDARGRDRYNAWLSRKRAEYARQYLVDRGIAANRVSAVGYGETQLRNNCLDGVDCEENLHQENRRTEIKVLKK